jgi:hypothetical protein
MVSRISKIFGIVIGIVTDIIAQKIWRVNGFGQGIFKTN